MEAVYQRALYTAVAQQNVPELMGVPSLGLSWFSPCYFSSAIQGKGETTLLDGDSAEANLRLGGQFSYIFKTGTLVPFAV